MTSASVKRTIRFPTELADALERRAMLDGLPTAEFVRRVVEREIDGRETEAVLAELRAIRRDLTAVVDKNGKEQKSFVLEAALGLEERLAASNSALLKQLLGSIPEPSTGSSSLHELLPGLNLST